MTLPMDPVSATCGTFYILIATWWWIQVTKRYSASGQRHVDYISSVTYPCCYSCRRLPVEGTFKLISCCFLAVLGAYRAVLTENSPDCNMQDRGIAQLTVFIVFAASAMCDIMTQLCQRYVFPSLDYFLLFFAFTVQGVVSITYSEKDLTRSAIAVGDNLTMISAAATALFILLEFRLRTFVWFSLGRSYFTFVLGSWLWHMAFLLQNNNTVDIFNTNLTDITTSLAINQSASSDNLSSQVRQEDMLQLETATEIHEIQSQRLIAIDLSVDGASDEELLYLPLYFTWHCIISAILLMCLWLVTDRLTSQNKCICVPLDEEVTSHFENRIHFDYHILDRLDSDMD